MRTPRPGLSVADLVATAKATIENLDPNSVIREVDRGAPLLVDIREREELEDRGSIEGAVHAPRGMIEFYATLGYTNVAHLDGGLIAWKAAGLPTSPAPAPERQR